MSWCMKASFRRSSASRTRSRKCKPVRNAAWHSRITKTCGPAMSSNATPCRRSSARCDECVVEELDRLKGEPAMAARLEQEAKRRAENKPASAVETTRPLSVQEIEDELCFAIFATEFKQAGSLSPHLDRKSTRLNSSH